MANNKHDGKYAFKDLKRETVTCSLQGWNLLIVSEPFFPFPLFHFFSVLNSFSTLLVA